MKQSAIVGAGAMIGALLRYGLTMALPEGWWILLLINAVGCFLIAFMRNSPFLTTGVLGGFTSYSAFQMQLSTSLLPLIPMFAGCLLAYLCGSALSRKKHA